MPGITTQKLFYHCLNTLRLLIKPVKELKAATGDIVINEKNQVIVLEQNKIFLPPSSYLAWGFNDHSIRFGVVGSEKVYFFYNFILHFLYKKFLDRSCT